MFPTMSTSSDPRRVLLLMSDTGGGHRAAAEAIRAALIERHGEAVSVEMVDVFRDYTPFPFKYAPEMYPWWIKNGKLMWRVSYEISNRRGRARVLMGSLGGTIRRGLRRMLVRESDADVIVCVHPFFPMAAMQVLRSQLSRPPFITVVTDLVSTHVFWFERSVDRILVPTQPAYDYGIGLGIRPEQMRVTGLPVHPRFAAGLVNKQEARDRLNWRPDLPVLLLVGGGEGMGPLFRIARRINALNAPCQIAIVAGPHELLRKRLEAQPRKQPTYNYPIVTNMPELIGTARLLG